MARKRVQLRREEIIDATVRQIADRGIPATRVKDIAKDLDVSTGLIFYHFEAKEALVAAAFPRAMARDLELLDEIVQHRSSARSRICDVLGLYGPAGDAAGWRLWIDGWAAALQDDGMAAVMRDIDARWRDALSSLIAEGNESGEFICSDPEASASRITALLDGLAVRVVARRDELSAGLRKSWVATVLDFELAAA